MTSLLPARERGQLRDADDLRAIATAAARDLEGAPAVRVMEWARDTFGPNFAVASSMQDAVVLHLASTVIPGVDVLFLETGYHFPETLQTRQRVAATYDVTVRDVRPQQTVAQQDAAYGKDLYASDPDLCCTLRKTQPLDETLDTYEAWATGVRRGETQARANTPVVSFDERRERIKVAPIVSWTDADVERYIAEHNIVTNPLLTQGYPSIGCRTCTRRVAPGEDPRSGRWAGQNKTECGVNL